MSQLTDMYFLEPFCISEAFCHPKMVRKKSWSCPKGLNFAIVVIPKSKSCIGSPGYILYIPISTRRTYGLIVTRLMNAIKEVLVRTAGRVIRDASASPQNLLKELTRDISDRLRDWFLLQAAQRRMVVSHLNSCWYMHIVRLETTSRWLMTPCQRNNNRNRGTKKVRNSGLGPDPDQSAKNGPE